MQRQRVHDRQADNSNSPQPKVIVLAGNPNVGKSALFYALTGRFAEVSNFPGTTLEVVGAPWGSWTLLDLPGIYGLQPLTAEEEIACAAVRRADAVINVIDPWHMERDLFLTLEMVENRLPVVVALNYSDELTGGTLTIDHQLLSRRLGVPVIPVSAVNGEGLRELEKAVHFLLLRRADQGAAGEFSGMSGNSEHPKRDKRGEALSTENGLNHYVCRRQQVNWLVSEVIKCYPAVKNNNIELRYRLSRLLLSPWTGIPFLILVLTAVYFTVGVLVAQVVVDWTLALMADYYEPVVYKLVSDLFTSDNPLKVILVGRFGLFTMAVSYLMGLLVPLVLGFYFVLSLLEDSGYLPRVAVLLDRLFSRLGLNGQAVIPFVLGFGCVTMACITARILPSERERRMAVILLLLMVPCSSQMAVITAMAARLGLASLIFYVLMMVLVFLTASWLLQIIFPGRPTPLFIDLPFLRWPRLDNVWRKTYHRSTSFLKEAAPLFAAGALVLSGLEITGGLNVVQKMMEPVTVKWLHLPPEVAGSFLLGFFRRDFGSAGVFRLAMTTQQQLTALFTLTLFVPCLASTMVLFKERGWREAIVIWPLILGTAFFTGGVVARILERAATLSGDRDDGAAVASMGLVILLLMLAVFRAGYRAIWLKWRDRL